MAILSRSSGSPGPVPGRLRTGQGWDENTASDLLGEILHTYREHVEKALGLALLSEKF
jgi:hypothetical protein